MLFRSTLADAEQRDCASTIHQAGTHLLKLVNSILELTKIEAGRLELRREQKALRPLVNQVVSIQTAFAAGKGLALSVEFDHDLPDMVYCDETRLIEILNNLIHNAIKFTKEGSVSVHIGQGAEGIRFSVKDTGMGIPAEAQPYIFDRFRQASNFDTRQHEGSGLGLALARELVELMGGRIGFHTTEGKGSEFYFTLPQRKGGR